MAAEQAVCKNQIKQQTKENIKSVLEGLDMQKLKKIHKKALKKDDHEIVEAIRNVVIERVLKNF